MVENNYPYRTHLNVKHFDGKEELRRRPNTTTIAKTIRWTQRTKGWMASNNISRAKVCPSC